MTAAKAKPRYKEIIAGLPEFEKSDRFKMNIVNCALLCAFVLGMPKRPDVKRLTAYYAGSMMIPAMKWFLHKSGKSKFSDKDIASMKAAEELKAADRNPYSWNMEFLPYPDGSGYEARFTACGICTLMRELGLYDLVPAMCRLDYTMSEESGARMTGWILLVIIVLLFPAAFLYGAWDGLQHGFTFWQFAGRFLAMLYLMKAFDIIFLDWFLLTKSRFFQHYYPETKGCAGYHQFGFNRREQLARIIVFTFIALAWICILL